MRGKVEAFKNIRAETRVNYDCLVFPSYLLSQMIRVCICKYIALIPVRQGLQMEELTVLLY